MRDKDAYLIFESYKKRVVLNEAASVAIPATLSIPSTILASIVGTAGAVVIGNQIKEMFSKLTGQEQAAYQQAVQQLNGILEKADTSARGCSELVGFILSNSKDKILIEFAQTHQQILQTANYLTNEMAWNKEQLESLVFQAEGANTQLVNYATQQRVKIEVEGKAGVDAFNRMLDMMGGSGGGGGGGGGGGKPPKPPKRGGWFAALMGGVGTLTGTVIASIWNKVTGANWKFLALAALIALSINPELAKNFTKGLTQAAGEAAEGAVEGAKEAFGTPQAQPTPKPKAQPTPQPQTSADF